MTIRPFSSNEGTQSPFDLIPPELKMDIAERTGSVMEEFKKIPLYEPGREAMVAQAKSDAARYLANLGVVNQEFNSLAKQAARKFPYVGMAATSMTIRNISQDCQFREKIVSLIKGNKDIEVPFHHLSCANQKIVLQELARPEVTQHLEVVKLDLYAVELGLDPQQGSDQQERPTGVSRSRSKIARMLGKHFKKHRDVDVYVDVPEEPVFSHLLTAIHAMSQHNNQFPKIELNLAHAKLGDQGVIALARILPQCKVRSLCLKDNRIGESGARALANALPHSTLAELDLSYNYEMKKDGLRALAEGLALSKLVSLNLNNNGIGDDGVVAIVDALPDSLLNLSLHGNGIGDAGGAAIGAVLARSSLMNLDMSFNIIGGDGAIAIAHALSNSKLINLRLLSNTIRVEGAIAIFNELPQSCLKYLNLGMNKIIVDRSTATAIADALPFSRLEYLDISENSFHYKREVMRIINEGRRGENPAIIG